MGLFNFGKKKQQTNNEKEEKLPPKEEVNEENEEDNESTEVEEEEEYIEETPEEAEVEDIDEEEPVIHKPVFIYGPDGEKIYPGRTFMDRLLVADDSLKKMYSDLKNGFLSYKKVHTRISKTNDAFRFEGKLIGKIIVAGNGLKVYLALDPMEVDSAIYHQRDASGKKHFKETPLVVRVKSPLSYRKAMKLISKACEKLTVKKQRFKPKDWSNPETKEDIDEE